MSTPAEPCTTPHVVKDMEDYSSLHAGACAKGEKFYTDPASGYMVMTKDVHLARGKCCGSGCRHCPYSHINVKDKASRIQNPALMHTPASGFADNVVVLMWSGGKDSFLALRAMLRPGGRLCKVGPSGVVLLTTFDAATRMVAHQDVSAHDIERQARHLDLGLVGVPLHRNAGAEYVQRLKEALDVVRSAGCSIDNLACGDLHLEHIRSWPSGVTCFITAVTEPRLCQAGIKVGAEYGRSLAAAATQMSADAFGEKGEFHTLAAVWEVTRERALGTAAV
eukprot:gene20239-34419_t